MSWAPLLGIATAGAILVGIVACTPFEGVFTPSGRVGAPVPPEVIPEGLRDCQFYMLESSSGTRYHVVRCPNSSVSLTKPGKYQENTATIDGGPATPNIPLDAKSEHDCAVDALLQKIDAEIARLEAKKKELR